MLDNKFVPQFNITLRCNMYDVCEYCYVKEQKRNFPLDMEPQDFNNIISWFKALGVDEIIFLGGEPILHPKFSEFLETIKNNAISARLFTNGTYGNTIAKLISASKYVETIFFHYDENYLKRSAQTRAEKSRVLPLRVQKNPVSRQAFPISSQLVPPQSTGHSGVLTVYRVFCYTASAQARERRYTSGNTMTQQLLRLSETKTSRQNADCPRGDSISLYAEGDAP